MRELPNDASRQPLLRDERCFAPHPPVLLRIEELEHQTMLVVEQRYAAINHYFAIADTRYELVQVEREPRRECALAKSSELLCGMDDFGERPTHRATQAHAEQALCGGVQIRDEQLVVEQHECRR